jgi:hypothetical protein
MQSGPARAAVFAACSDCVNLLTMSGVLDSQKIRDDLSFDLDWRVLSGPSGVRAPLMKLLNTKAAQVLGVESIDVLSYFPAQIAVGGRGKTPRTFPTFQYLLNMTRHTPRDLLRLFEEIRKVDASGLYGHSEDVLNPQTIHEGVLQYASKYFVGAISNEFAGYQGGPESALSAMAAPGDRQANIQCGRVPSRARWPRNSGRFRGDPIAEAALLRRGDR